jgi:hypothetical protein
MGERRRGSVLILALAAACLLAAGISGYGAYAVLDRDAFADRALHALDSDEVREEVGARVAGRLAGEASELSQYEPLIADAVAERVTLAPAYRTAFREGALRLNDSLFGDADAPATMTVAGSGALTRAELEDRGAALRRLEDVPLFALGASGPERVLRRLAPTAAELALPLSLVLAAIGLALLAVAVVRERNHRQAVWAAGLAVAAAAGLTAVGVTAAQDLVLDTFDTDFGDAVVSSIWGAYLADLRGWALALGAAGLVVAAAAGGPRPSPATLFATPATRRGRAWRAAALLAAAALAIRFPELVLHAALVTIAAGLVYVAAGDLLPSRPRPPRPAGSRRAAASARERSSTGHPRSSSRPRRRW